MESPSGETLQTAKSGEKAWQEFRLQCGNRTYSQGINDYRELENH